LQRKSAYLVWLIIALAGAAFFLAWQYRDYRVASRTLPPDVMAADLQVGGTTRAEALNALEVAFATPLTVTYGHETLSLCPSVVELQYDANRTAANLDAALREWRGLQGFVSHILGEDSPPLSVPVAIFYSEGRLTRYLERVSDQFDGSPREPVALPAVLDFRPPRPGYRLDVERSRTRVASALVSASTRQVDLVVEIEEPPRKDLALLRQLLEEYLDDYPGLIPGIFIKDLQTGAELGINSGVAYAGLSVLKIALLEEAYRTLDRSPDLETTQLISRTMVESDNAAANLLLCDVIGEGDADLAAEKLTASMNQLGLSNTFMGALYDEKERGVERITEANSRTDVSTQPDPYIQTTPLDVGLLLEMIYHCAHGGGTLVLNYPDSVTPEECREMIHWMTRNPVDNLIEAGVPEGTRVAHKHGWSGDTCADAGIVYTAAGDYVLVIFLHRTGWLEWDRAAPLIGDISTATYNYFNS